MTRTARLIASFLLGAAVGCTTWAEQVPPQKVAQLRAKILANRESFFANEAGKPLVRGTIKKNWNDRGDFTRHYGQSIVMFAMRACVLSAKTRSINA